jgi:hypothetical protein
MPIYTSPTNVTNGTVLTQTMLDTLFGTNGTLNYLYDGLATYSPDCPLIFINANSAATNLANNTTRTEVFTTFTSGSQYWNGSTAFTTASCNTQSLTGRRFFIYYQSNFGANATGFRRTVLTIGNTNNTTEFASYVATRYATPTDPTTVQQSFIVPIVDTTNPSQLTFTITNWQNSGATITCATYVRIYQLPNI